MKIKLQIIAVAFVVLAMLAAFADSGPPVSASPAASVTASQTDRTVTPAAAPVNMSVSRQFAIANGWRPKEFISRSGGATIIYLKSSAPGVNTSIKTKGRDPAFRGFGTENSARARI